MKFDRKMHKVTLCAKKHKGNLTPQTSGFRPSVWIISVALTLVFTLLPSQGYSKNQTKPNVLFLVSDDMNDWMQCLGGHPDAITPNLERLAERSVLFEQAHCSVPVCNPSRASLMTGLCPTTTGVYNNRHAFRMSPVGFDAITIPRYFSLNGYYSTGSGKITHGKFPDPASWDSYYPNLFYQNYKGAEPSYMNFNKIQCKGFDWAPLDVKDAETADGITTTKIINLLSEQYDKPFFIACGWKLPHLPWYAPRKYFEMYDPKTIRMPLILKDDEKDLPAAAMKYVGKSNYQAITRAGKEREGVHAYLACTTFIDAQLGLVLDALDASPYAKNTIIVFWGDHGWHLGEKKRWHKNSLWEEATRAPLMISAPGIKPGKVDTPISFLDIYPTLVELAGLPPNKDLDGMSMVSLMKDKNAKWERPALSVRDRGNYSLRSKRWRYTRYKDGGEELYDHSKDPMEWKNLASDPEYKPIIEQMKKWLPKNEAQNIRKLQWPKEKKAYWDATLKAAERYHGDLSQAFENTPTEGVVIYGKK